MKPLFTDTGCLTVLETSDDQNHKSALIYGQKLCMSLPPLITTSYVFDETVTFKRVFQLISLKEF